VNWSAFTQAGGRITRHYAAREDARRAAQVMADAFRRTALVYAIDPQGRSAVADTIQPSTNQQKESPVTQTFAKRFNAQRAARKALGADAQEGVAFRTFKVNGGFAWEMIPTETVDAVAMPSSPESTVASRLPKARRAESAAKAGSAPTGKRAAIEEAARRGHLPPPPDFSAPTHARFRAKLAKLVALAEAGDAEGLKAIAINPISTSPRAMARYRDLALLAIEAKRGA
jgi:hypothetical protein